jgi:hypothetical protein
VVGPAVRAYGQAMRRRSGILTAAAVLAGCALAPAARADFYPYGPEDLITSRTGPYPPGLNNGVPRTGVERAYKGPRVFVRGYSTNSDTYQCAKDDEQVNGWVAVANDLLSNKRSFTSTSTAYLGQAPPYSVTTTNWSEGGVNLRVVSACTPDPNAFPYHLSYGPYNYAWIASLWSGAADYVKLVRTAFKWDAAGTRAVRAAPSPPALAPLVPAAAPSGNRYALRNGVTTLDLTFRQPRGDRRPPAIYYSTQPATAGCEAQRMPVTVVDGFGTLHLVLHCHGLQPGASAKLLVRPAIRRTFLLRRGSGSGRIHLDKPPGRVAPLVFLGAGSAPCTITRNGLRLARRTMDLRIEGRCGAVQPGARGELAVGGLIAADRP